jgi:hypothetical protein
MADIGGASVEPRAIAEASAAYRLHNFDPAAEQRQTCFCARRLSPIWHWPASLAMRAWLGGCEEEKR